MPHTILSEYARQKSTAQIQNSLKDKILCIVARKGLAYVNWLSNRDFSGDFLEMLASSGILDGLGIFMNDAVDEFAEGNIPFQRGIPA